jgi:hypothetical protein
MITEKEFMEFMLTTKFEESNVSMDLQLWGIVRALRRILKVEDGKSLLLSATFIMDQLENYERSKSIAALEDSATVLPQENA